MNNDSTNKKCIKCPTFLNNIYKLGYSLITLYAIYLSFKCNQGFKFFSFLGAVILGPIYILYLIIFKKFCNN